MLYYPIGAARYRNAHAVPLPGSCRYYLKGDSYNEKDIQNANSIDHRNDLPHHRRNHDMVRAYFRGS